MFYQMDEIINFRDLGGLVTKDGARVRPGCLFRCGELEKATERDLERLKNEFGIRTLIDFRDPGEARERPDRLPEGARLYSFPALPPMQQPKDRMKDGLPPDAEEIFPRIYRQLAESVESIEAYRAFFRCILVEGAAPLLWHCRQGKDRTGVAAILLLTALGVSRADCVREYLLTNDFMRPRVEAYRQKESTPWKIRMMEIISFVREDWLNEYFRSVDEKFGGTEAYLRNVMLLTEGDIETLRHLYLE